MHQDLLKNYVQRLEELPFILQRQVTLLKDNNLNSGSSDSSSNLSLNTDAKVLTLREDEFEDVDGPRSHFLNELESLLFEESISIPRAERDKQILDLLNDAIINANQRCQISQELRQRTANAVAGLDQTLRDLVKYVLQISPPSAASLDIRDNQVNYSTRRKTLHSDDEENEEDEEEEDLEEIKRSRSMSRRLRSRLKLAERKLRRIESKRSTKRKSKQKRTGRQPKIAHRLSKRSRIVSDESEKDIASVSDAEFENDHRDDEDEEEGESSKVKEEAEFENTKEEEEEEGENESMPDIICTCRKPPSGDMIACDNDINCPIEWFHLECVGLKKAPLPDEPWFCEQCTLLKQHHQPKQVEQES